MGHALLSEKPPLGAKVAQPHLSATQRAASRWGIKEKSVLRVRCASGEGLPGQYFDQESGNHYNYFRDYNPVNGRYLQSDPIGPIFGSAFVEMSQSRIDGVANPLTPQELLLAGLNHPYNYVDNNTLGYIDPLGLWKLAAGGRGSFFFGGAGGTAGVKGGFDGSGQFCFQVETCGRIGAGASTSASFTASIGSGNFCSGNSLGGGIFGTVGLGPIASLSSNSSSSGTTVTAGVGAGGGASAGFQGCITRTFCKQVF